MFSGKNKSETNREIVNVFENKIEDWLSLV